MGCKGLIVWVVMMQLPRGPGPSNNLLGVLRDSDYALISPHLREERTSANDLLYNPGDNVDVVHFPRGPSLVAFWLATKMDAT
jgi:hypothetical protein